MSKSIVSAMSNNVNVGIDEVVSVFVSQYEDNLFDKKKELSGEIKRLKGELSDLDKRLKGSVDTKQYETKVPVINISSKVEDVDVRWKGDDSHYDKIKKSVVRVSIEVSDNDDNDRYSSSFTKRVDIPVTNADQKLHDSLTSDLEGANSELVEIMGLIKSVSRKERQVRGRISAMKLEESGFADLLESPEMLQLVQLD